MIADGLDVLGAVLAILVARAATNRLEGRVAALQAGDPGGRGEGWDAPERPAGAPA